MSDADAFADARRIFEISPGAGTMEHAVTKLARAGVPPSRIRGWAVSISAEFGTVAYIRPVFDRLMARAIRISQEAAQWPC